MCLQAKPEDTLDLCKLLNDDIAGTVAKHPRRFIGLGTLPMQVRQAAYELMWFVESTLVSLLMQAPDLAVQELHRCVKVYPLQSLC